MNKKDNLRNNFIDTNLNIKDAARRLRERKRQRHKARSSRKLSAREILGVTIAAIAVAGIIAGTVYVSHRQHESLMNSFKNPQATMAPVDENGHIQYTPEEREKLAKEYEESLKKDTLDDSKGIGGK